MSETTNLKLFKHDKPVTNINLFDAQKALNDNWDKIDKAVGDINTTNENQDKTIDEFKKKEIKLVTIAVSQLIQAEIEYTLPCNYKVGNHSLRVHWENVLLEEGENGNYMEIGDKDSISNKIKFGWDIEAGETLIIEVRGVVDE